MSSGLTGIGVVFAVAGGVLFARHAVNSALRKRAQGVWRDTCERAGLRLGSDNPLFPRAAGTIDGIPIEAWVDELKTRGLTQSYVRVRAEIAGLPEVFVRSRKTELERSTWHDTQTGDAHFDAVIRVTAPHRRGIGEWLTPPRRAQLMALEETGVTWSVGDGVLGLSQRGLTETGDEWRSQLTQLARTAKVLAAT